MKRSNLLAIVSISAFSLPLLSFWAYCLWIRPSGNYFINDAVFPYFMNSLAPFDGGAYRYVDHPGTPVEILGSLLIGLTAPFVSQATDGFIVHHLGNPGLFFTLAAHALVLGNIVCVLVLFRTAQTSDGTRGATLAMALAIMYFAIHTDSLGTVKIWNHNSFSFPLGALLSLLLLRSLEKQAPRPGGLSAASLAWLGMGAGLLAAITIYMLAWLMGITAAVILYYAIKRLKLLDMAGAILVTVGASVLGFLLSTLPVIRLLPGFLRWAYRILTHRSGYLSVPEHEPTLDRIYDNSIRLLDTQPALFLATALVLILGVVVMTRLGKHASAQPAAWAFFGGLAAQTIVLLFILLDRPSRDAYFLSLAATLPLLLLAILRVLQPNASVHRWLAWGISGLILLGICNTTIRAVNDHQAELSSLEQSKRTASEAIRQYSELSGRDPAQAVILWTHDAQSTCWGLRLGDLKAGRVFTREVDRLCPNEYQLSNSYRVLTSEHSYRLHEMEWDIIFTCDRFVRNLTETYPSLIVQRRTDIQWACGSMTVIYNPETIPRQ